MAHHCQCHKSALSLQNLPFTAKNRDFLRIQAILAEKTWIGFDLDDTLHEFRQASKAATTEVLGWISRKWDAPLPTLKEEYLRILANKTANAFTDGRTAAEYRRERFGTLLDHSFLPLHDAYLSYIVRQYDATLMKSLQLKPGALDLLKTIKSMGKKIVVITEGPQDAQEQTIEALGLNEYIDFLATSNDLRVSKTMGLFPKVLQHLEISSDEMAYIGDSDERDMKPALANAIFCVRFAEMEDTDLASTPPSISSLTDLQQVLQHGNADQST
ncbi:HAD-superfamily hydrolase, subfamily IA, variant 1 [Microthyrium microscopicum]|uniref:HAD-superfamily hydrolase, subfamily IA, variant 1 n=1 Tax=Microthyrium microscopicum TaxID=703497 RepID=A0A6A6U054_9PEZI|nr:HAD-superfamily hydrolase, subfamily IA, variant 1 [Microthyrium microscopicum]